MALKERGYASPRNEWQLKRRKLQALFKAGLLSAAGEVLPPVVNIPTLSFVDLTQSSGSAVVGDNLQFTATTNDGDNFTTTGVDLYESGNLVAHMVQGPTATWTATDSNVSTGAKSYTARRLYSGGSVNSSPTAITVLGALDPSQVTTATLLGWWRSSDSITIGATPLAAGGGTPPALTFGGTRTAQTVSPFITTDSIGTGALGNTTVKISLDGGSTFVETGVATTANSTHTIAGAGGLTVIFPASGTFTAGQTWKGIANPFVSKVVPGTDDFANATAGQRPTIAIVAADNGLLELVYDGVDDRQLVTGTKPNTIFGGTNTPFYIVVQCRINAIPTSGVIFAASSSSDANIPLVQIFVNTTSYGISRRVSGADNKQASSVIVPQTGYHLFEYGFDGTNGVLRKNSADIVGGNSVVAAPMNTAGAITINQLCIGGRVDQTGANNFLSVQIMEIAIFNHAPTGAELYQQRAYY